MQVSEWLKCRFTKNEMSNVTVHRFHCAYIGVSLLLTDSVLSQLWRYRQKSHRNHEAGGMLFTRELSGGQLHVTSISTPGLHDKATPTSFVPDRKRGLKIIESKFKQGESFIGEWHTHHEIKPSPSPRDKETIKSLFNQSTHDMPLFILMIIPKNPEPSSIYLSATDGELIYTFTYISSSN